jgi:hypothetical protein
MFPDEDIPLIALDIETRPMMRDDPVRLSVAKAASYSNLQVITAIAMLTVAESDDDQVVVFSGAEDRMLTDLDRALSRSANHMLLTFNGMRHDLPIIELRAIHLGLFGHPGLSGLQARRHLDLMRLIPFPCSLEALAASTNLSPPLTQAGLTAPEKCELDVLTTYLAYLQLREFRTGNTARLMRLWRGLANDIRERRRAGHLAHLFRDID